ncbi:MAG: cytochrome b/b6 domain-containing protein [Actinomycetota bacterium]|nr:cytochrome b/b6 domain-containing protein [Actinomycetota bacterium]
MLHWVNAILFASLILTASVLYIAPLTELVGRRVLVRSIHVWSGLLLPFPLIAARLGPWRRAFAADVRTLARFDDDDRMWLRTLGRSKDVRMGKFHPGQKLNAAFTLGAIAVMLGTGSVMHWFRFFPVDWRTGATFVHDWLAIVLAVVVAGHIRMAYSDRDSFRGMTQGWVPTIWARRHRPKWYEELTGRPAGPPPPVEAASATARLSGSGSAPTPPDRE